MNYRVQISVLGVLATTALPGVGWADYWARLDRPWTNWEVTQAIEYCRVQPKVDARVRVFVDTVMGQQIDKCMHALGWVGVAR